MPSILGHIEPGHIPGSVSPLTMQNATGAFYCSAWGYGTIGTPQSQTAGYYFLDFNANLSNGYYGFYDVQGITAPTPVMPRSTTCAFFIKY